MLLQELTKKLAELNKQKLELKQKEKELANQSLEERVLEVSIEDLINELSYIFDTKKVSINYSNVYAPTHCANKIELAKLWIKKRNPKVHITIHIWDYSVHTITQNLADLKLDNGEHASDHIYINYCNVGIVNEFRNKVMLNINPLDKELNNPVFKQAVYNCVERREAKSQEQTNKPRKVANLPYCSLID